MGIRRKGEEDLSSKAQRLRNSMPQSLKKAVK